jgi:hypothetical protein
MKHGSTLYLEITTNNFAYYTIEVYNRKAHNQAISKTMD